MSFDDPKNRTAKQIEDFKRKNEAYMSKNRETVKINKQIAQHAKRKELQEVVLLFNDAKSRGFINSHTYASTLNTYVRCGDLEKAMLLFDEIRTHATLKLDVISCTTMMKGYGSRGDIRGCLYILEAMEKAKPKVIPNVRTLNTFLRCCVLLGERDKAEVTMQKMIKEHKIVPDISSWEYLVTLQAQSLCLDKALPIIGRLRGKNDPSIAGGLAAMNISLARAAIFTEDHKLCRRCISSAEAFLLTDENYNPEVEVLERPDVQEVSGGKRSWKQSNESRQQSLKVFRGHKAAEMRQDIAGISSYLSKHPESGEADVLSFYHKIFLFNSLKTETSSGSDAVVVSLVQALVDSLGMKEILKRRVAKANNKLTKEELLEMVSALERETALRFEQFISPDGFIRFVKVFENDLPLKLEICSGAGEWACAQAAKDVGVANWLTAELRNDRVYSTFSRAVLNGVTNMCMLAGDVMKILPKRISSVSVSGIFVNHPEPPQQTGYDRSQGSHLLDETFFSEAVRVLVVGGMLTIVTDNLWYGKLLCKLIPSLGATSVLCNVDLAPRSIQQQCNGICLYEGQPGPECGHIADASSYFDRLKSKELQSRVIFSDRYIICLRKVKGGLVQKRGLVIGSTTSTTSAGSLKNKKIKFDGAM